MRCFNEICLAVFAAIAVTGLNADDQIPTHGNVTHIVETEYVDGYLCQIEFNQPIEGSTELKAYYEKKKLYNSASFRTSSFFEADTFSIYRIPNVKNPKNRHFLGRALVNSVDGNNAVVSCLGFRPEVGDYVETFLVEMQHISDGSARVWLEKDGTSYIGALDYLHVDYIVLKTADGTYSIPYESLSGFDKRVLGSIEGYTDYRNKILAERFQAEQERLAIAAEVERMTAMRKKDDKRRRLLRRVSRSKKNTDAKNIAFRKFAESMSPRAQQRQQEQEAIGRLKKASGPGYPGRKPNLFNKVVDFLGNKAIPATIVYYDQSLLDGKLAEATEKQTGIDITKQHPIATELGKRSSVIDHIKKNY